MLRSKYVYLVIFSILVLLGSEVLANPIIVVNPTIEPMTLSFGSSENPSLVKLPKYAFCGSEPLNSKDRILDVRTFTNIKLKTLYSEIPKVLTYVYTTTQWNPKDTRTLVIKENYQVSWSTGGGINAMSTSMSPTAYNSMTGSLLPSYGRTYSNSKYTIYIFHVEQSESNTLVKEGGENNNVEKN